MYVFKNIRFANFLINFVSRLFVLAQSNTSFLQPNPLQIEFARICDNGGRLVLLIAPILPSSTSLLRSIVLLPPFLSSHRRARAQSYAVPPAAPISPQVLRTPARKALAVLNTPPPKPSYAQQLKLKGSLTDPPHTRRRPPFGHVRINFSYTFHTLSSSID